MKVAHLHALLAWIQSQNLCLIDSLVLERQNTHCLEIEASAMRALHSLTATILCQIDHINATSFSGPERIPNLRPIKLVVTWEVALPFVCRVSVARAPIDDRVAAVLSSVIKKIALHQSTSKGPDPTQVWRVCHKIIYIYIY